MRILHICLIAFLVASGAYAQDMLFPQLTADDLNGRSVNLPADLPGKPTIVFVAYKREQQPQINAWVEALGLSDAPTPAWVELPVVGQFAALFRPIIDNGMRSGIISTAARARTITIYSSQSAFNAALGITDTSKIYTLLVDPDGTVHNIIEGAVDKTKAAEIKRAMR